MSQSTELNKQPDQIAEKEEITNETVERVKYAYNNFVLFNYQSEENTNE